MDVRDYIDTVVSTPAGKLIDSLAQRGDGMKYSWSNADRIECWMQAVSTADMLINDFGLPIPSGFYVTIVMINTMHQLVNSARSNTDSSGSGMAQSNSKQQGQ